MTSKAQKFVRSLFLVNTGSLRSLPHHYGGCGRECLAIELNGVAINSTLWIYLILWGVKKRHIYSSVVAWWCTLLAGYHYWSFEGKNTEAVKDIDMNASRLNPKCRYSRKITQPFLYTNMIIWTMSLDSYCSQKIRQWCWSLF